MTTCQHPAWSAQADGITLYCLSCGVPHPLSAVANAKLIAAAPVLADRLEFDNLLLKRVASFLESSTDNDELLDDVNGAIGHNAVALRAAGRLP